MMDYIHNIVHCVNYCLNVTLLNHRSNHLFVLFDCALVIITMIVFLMLLVLLFRLICCIFLGAAIKT